MQQVLIGIILILGLGGFWLYNENVTLKENNIKLEAAVEEQKKQPEKIKHQCTMCGSMMMVKKPKKHRYTITCPNCEHEEQFN